MRHFTPWLVACLALATGCEASAVFQCQSEVQCTLDGKAGTCEPNGYCSFADPTCPSGQRYGDQAPGGLAGGCVAPAEDTNGATGDCMGPACAPTASSTGSASTDSASNGSASTQDPTSGETQTDESSGRPPSSGGTTDPSGGTTDSGDASSSDASSSSATGDPTTGGTVCPEFVDEFDNGIVDEPPWVVFDGGGLMSEAGDTMRFSIDPSGSFYSFMIIPELDVTEGYAVAHLVALPQDSSSEFLLRVFDDDGLNGVALGVTGDRRISPRVNGVVGTEFVYDPAVSDLWLELVFDGTNVTFSFSTDGTIYTELDSLLSPLVNPSSAEVSMAAGSFSPIMSPAHVIEVNVFEFCSSPFDG